MFWQTFSRALYNLAAYPQYVGPLREEIDAVIREHGWAKKAIALTRKAFCQRTKKKAMTDLTLSDGTRILKGTHLSLPPCVLHRDNAVYNNPGVFNPFHDDRDGSAGQRTVIVTQDYVPFGYGKHAWYGCAPIGVATPIYSSTIPL
ncbi:hypothetical protein PISMIDRAFT_103358 [Pisolithus microcarpus 441]|uniref:Uncharacterized protein n=1 Tax=Pisolithus microcarpus 441 TaxID=765257 RepID=A0A0C9Z6Z7_9AGAM|nr:cytochrome P450 [Pisolithus microcarpus]KIK21824.1 hypothetical protein PISMIDRAFT_103358 [Pisolithus microcarpus 441]